MNTPYDGKIAFQHWAASKIAEQTIGEVIGTLGRLAPNVGAIWVKAFDGNCWQGVYDTPSKDDLRIDGEDDLVRWITQCAAAGLDVHAWGVVCGTNVETELSLLKQISQISGLKSLVLDIEVGSGYFRGGPETAERIASQLRIGAPSGFHIGLMLDARGSHPDSIYVDRWLPYIDSLHPMVYWQEFGVEPRVAVQHAFESLAEYGKPVFPALQTYNLANPQDVVEAANEATAGSGRYHADGISLFRYGAAVTPEATMRAIATIPKPIPDPGPIPLATYTNQDIINAFYRVAKYLGKTDEYWQMIVSAGLSYLASNRNQRYGGRAIEDLSGLTDEEKVLLGQALAGEPLERVLPTPEDEGIVGKFTNQQVINAFYTALEQRGVPREEIWDRIVAVGLDNLANNRQQLFAGPPIASLDLDEDTRRAVIGVLKGTVIPGGVPVCLEVPWVSQEDASSTFRNDCGPACVLMLLKYHQGDNGYTVNDLCRLNIKVGSITKQLGGLLTGTQDLLALAKTASGNGLALEAITLTKNGALGSLRQMLHDQRPVIILVNYLKLREGGSVFSPTYAGDHWVVLTGYDDTSFTYHDPFWPPTPNNRTPGADKRIENDDLAYALRLYPAVG